MASPASAVTGSAGELVRGGLAPESFALGTFEVEGQATAGYIQGGQIWPLEEALPGHGNLEVLEVIRNWSTLQSSISKPDSPGASLADVKLLTPVRVVRPPMCVGKNYQEHVKEVDSWKGPGITQPSVPTTPIIFTKAAESVIGPGEAVQYPHGVSSEVDYEAELAVVIGTGGRGISREDALGHVFGYTILNDITARDLQRNHQQWFLGKSVDTFCPVGPWIVPASQIDGQNLGIKCWVNEELRQESRTSEMIFDIRDLIHTISAAVTLQPGDIIATGTPAGVGAGFKPPRWLVPGDTVTISVEGIGILQNAIE
ncbi:Myo-inositol-1-phosphate synthase [Klebsormidium nitens]|uniref:Myo-inositol-1-phosphate synthase n=1 Tax=Klebsormidium nitens TaxID=105231 RepID=A0A1Y1IDP3_KLENI|nr:Myo-inositol-1-phosphate synthase [Klebsormidium nitens]|eukprot:GAQ89074.1 Myo-inositol-1-phosphate synthase [Klebsormidium nitens]